MVDGSFDLRWAYVHMFACSIGEKGIYDYLIDDVADGYIDMHQSK
jgi:hypothetical protein